MREPDPSHLFVQGDAVPTSQLCRSGKGFSAPELDKLSRLSGIRVERLREALGTLTEYRLQGGLLQRRMYVQDSGTF